MHRILPLALLLACAQQRPRTVPPDWAQGAPAVVQAQVGGGWEPLKGAIENDLRGVGMRVVNDASDPATLVIRLGYGKPGFFAVDSLRGGRALDHYEWESSFSCMSWDCLAADAVGHIAGSPQIASEMQQRAPARRAAGSGKLAVLELKNFTQELTKENVQYLTDVVRQAALKSSGADVMTRENLLVLLQSSGKDLASCEGECEVDTGRRIGADQVVSGDVQKFGSKFKVSLRLHDTREGRLLSSATGTGAGVDDLEDSVARAAQQLFQPQ